MDQWVGASFIVTRPAPPGRSSAVDRYPNSAMRDQTKGKMRWSRLSSLLRRQLDRIVHPRLTEILVEVADIPVVAGEACLFRVGIRAAAAVFASGRLVLHP